MTVNTRKNDAGTAMMVVVTFTAAVSMLAAAFLMSVHQMMSESAQYERELEARNLAEAGLHEALARAIASGDTDVHIPSTSLGEGVYSARITQTEERLRIVSTGAIGPEAHSLKTVTIEALVRLENGAAAVESWREIRPSDEGDGYD